VNKILLLIISISVMFGFDFKKEYENGNFKKICKYGATHFQKIKNNEDILSLVGFSCVKSDYFIYLPIIINQLKYSKKARSNSIYFSLLFFDKKLLQSYMLDNLDLSFYRLPLIEHPVSIVVNGIIFKKFKKDKDGVIQIEHKDKIYKVYSDQKSKKVFITIFDKNGILLRTHWYR